MTRVLDITMTIVGNLFIIIFCVYVTYILCTPGLELLFIAWLLIIAVLTMSLKCFKGFDKERIALLDGHARAEYLYARSYRKRYYSKLYTFVLASVLVTCLVLSANTIRRQVSYDKDAAFVNCVSTFIDKDSDDSDMALLHKLSWLLPNEVRDGITSTFNALYRNSTVLRDLSEKEDPTMMDMVEAQLCIESAKRELSVARNALDDMRFYTVHVYAVIVLVVFCWEELSSLIHHRSIKYNREANATWEI